MEDNGPEQLFESSKDVEILRKNFKCHVTGDYGSGKSTFASSFPTPGFVFDFDSGIETYRESEWFYSSYELSTKGWIRFEQDVIKVEKLVKEKKLKTVVVDATTTLMDVAMERALSLDPRRDPNTQGPMWNVHYQIVKNLISGKLRRIISFDCNVVVLSHVEIKQNQETGAIISIEPLLTGRLSAEVPGYFGEVYHCTTKREGKQTKYYIQTKTIGLYKARSRISGKLNILPDFVPNDYREVVKLIKTKENANG
jgi:hypothetical protein